MLFSNYVFAMPLEEAIKESAAARAKGPQTYSEIVKKLDLEFTKAKNEADKKSLSLFLVKLENLEELSKKPDFKSCARARNHVRLNNTLGKEETSPLDKMAQEAMAWIDLLCASVK